VCIIRRINYFYTLELDKQWVIITNLKRKDGSGWVSNDGDGGGGGSVAAGSSLAPTTATLACTRR
jgi:hypothetical protein